MTLGKVVDAKLSWENIDNLPKEHALWLFKTGLIRLAEEQFLEAKKLIEQGIASNDFSPELNRDMDTILASMPTEGANVEKANSDSVAGQARLNAYTLNND